ncbi:polysaccharide biosynthesis C-terminal domain-containing protein [Saccharococcus caldoxylosilyticus]|uniref:lipopolysaccharide biosynthesis protein n=1 Tax=Saccharococcus caldoxylosilyticus TaxID=81408 RepID=UPI003D334E5F
MSSVKNFGRDTIIYGIAVIISAFLGAFSVSIYTRIFAAKDYGEYNLVLSTSLFITTLFSQWIQQSIQRYRPEYKKNGKVNEFNTNLYILTIVTVFIIIGLSCLASLFKYKLGAYNNYYWASVCLILAQFIFLILSSLLQSDFKSKNYKNFVLINSILKFVLSVLLIFLFYKHPISIIYGTILAQLVLIIPMIRSTEMLSNVTNNFRFDDFLFFAKKFFLYGFPMIGWFLGNSILNLTDRYMLAILRSSKEVGIYSANFSIVSASLGLLTTPLLSAAHPIIMNGAYDRNNKIDVPKVKHLISLFSKIYLLITLPLFIFVFLFHKEIATIFLGVEYRKGSIIIPILFFGILVWNVSMFGHKGFEVYEKTKIMLLFILFSAVINIALNYLLIPIYGYNGASIATMISMISYSMLVYIFSYKFIKWELDFKSLIKVIFSGLVAGFFVYLLKDFVKSYIVQLISGAILGLLIYILILLLMKEIDYKTVKKLIINRLKKQLLNERVAKRITNA